jgi:methylase of polypeptide subunit release factors
LIYIANEWHHRVNSQDTPVSAIEPIQFNLGGHVLSLSSSPETFIPNTTTGILFDAAPPVQGKTVLDLGCGIGAIAIAAALSGAAAVTAADVMEQACDLAARNAAANGVADRVTVKRSYLFRDLGAARFDIVISDVTGMAEKVARLSPWYPSTIPTAGADGTDLAVEVLERAPDHLQPGGVLVFPIISLSRASLIEEPARRVFGDRLTKVVEKSIPFPPQLSKDREFMESEKRQGVIDYSVRGSRLCWTLAIYSGKAP